MPANFTEKEKELIKQKLFDQGYIFLEKYGMKKLKISELTKTCEIGTGTFYNFFLSKNDFILQLIAKRKQESIERFNILAQKYPEGIPFDETYKYFLNNLAKDNIYRLLSQAEYNSLIEETPQENNTQAVGKYIMSKLKTSKGVDAFMLFAECYKIIVIGSSDLTKLDKKILNKALASLVKAACEILY